MKIRKKCSQKTRRFDNAGAQVINVFCEGLFLKCSTALLESLVLDASGHEPGRTHGRNKGL